MNRLDHYLSSLTWNHRRERYVATGRWLTWLREVGLITPQEHAQRIADQYNEYVRLMIAMDD